SPSSLSLLTCCPTLPHPLFPYTTLFRSGQFLALRIAVATDVQHEPADGIGAATAVVEELVEGVVARDALVLLEGIDQVEERVDGDRKSTRLNSSHQIISYAVFCLKKKKK